MLCMNSVVNFVVVKLINKPAVQQTLENTIFVDNRRAREQTNVLSKETETVVFRKKIMKRKRENMRIGQVSPPHSPRDSDISEFFPPKQQKSDLKLRKKKTNKLAFYSGKLLKIQTNLSVNKENNEDVDYYHYPKHSTCHFDSIHNNERQPCPFAFNKLHIYYTFWSNVLYAMYWIIKIKSTTFLRP